MTALLAELERSWLVKRTHRPEDGRMRYIALTKWALEHFERVLQERNSRIIRFMSALTEDEQRQLRSLLETVELIPLALSALE